MPWFWRNAQKGKNSEERLQDSDDHENGECGK